MPNRILKESLLRSRKVALLTAEEERLFTRLILTVDDYGRFYADPAIVKAACLPNIADTITNDLARAWLDRLDEVGLISRYVVDGEVYLVLFRATEFNKTRAKEPKFAPPEKGQRFSMLASANIREHLQTSASIREHLRPYADADAKTDSNADADASAAVATERAASSPSGSDLFGQPIIDPIEAKVDAVLDKWFKTTGQTTAKIRGDGADTKRKRIRARLAETNGDPTDLLALLDAWLSHPFYGPTGKNITEVDKLFRNRDRVEEILSEARQRKGSAPPIAPTGPRGAFPTPGVGSVREERDYSKPPPPKPVLPEWTAEAALARALVQPSFAQKRLAVPFGKSLPDGFQIPDGVEVVYLPDPGPKPLRLQDIVGAP